MFSAASVCLFVCLFVLSVCLFVCLFVNTITSKRANIGMMKLGGRCIVQKSRPSSNLGVIDPLVSTPKNVALGYDVEKISAVNISQRILTFTTRCNIVIAVYVILVLVLLVVKRYHWKDCRPC